MFNPMASKVKLPGAKPSIKDVAEAAGVSRAAVSLVLNNGKIRIGEEKRKRIIEIARAMKYTPHIGARRLAMRRMETLGLVLPVQAESMNEVDLFDLTHHVAVMASEHGYDVLLHFYDSAGSAEIPETVGRVDGSIVVLGKKSGPDFASVWDDTHQPHIIIGGGFFLQKPANFVDVDLASGMIAATNHLLRLGHRDIAYVAVGEHNDKLNGYLIALTKAKIPIRREFIMAIGFTEEALVHAARTIQRMTPRPTGLVFTSDAVAIRMMRIFRDIGMQVPKDVSITGFDNIETASFVTPGLTSIRVPTRKMAELVVNQLVAIVEKKPAPVLQTMLSVELVVRESTAAPPR